MAASSSPPKAASPCATSAPSWAPACRPRRPWWWRFPRPPGRRGEDRETEWPELQLSTSGNPYLISQAEQDAALRNPRWVGKLASPSSATNSAFYFSHATREAARVLFNHGLWPAAMAIWRQGPYGGQANPLVVRRENAVWVNGELTANGLAPIPFAQLAKKAHDMGLVTGASVHGFNRWSWAEADFVIDGVRERLPLDAWR
jgi:CO/xanthine dehydrogenase Mo-binding subunit